MGSEASTHIKEEEAGKIMSSDENKENAKPASTVEKMNKTYKKKGESPTKQEEQKEVSKPEIKEKDMLQQDQMTRDWTNYLKRADPANQREWEGQQWTKYI